MTTAPKPEPGSPQGPQRGNPEGRRLPGWLQPRAAGGAAQPMLPGMALIALYLLVLSMINAFAAASGKYGPGAAKYTILGICTILVVGIFGLLRLLRWGWSIVTAGCLLMACGYFYGFHRTHIAPYIVQGLFALVFFLYLSRTEVRERLR